MIAAGIEGVKNHQKASYRLNVKQEEGMVSFGDALTESLNGENRIKGREVQRNENKVPYEQYARDGIINYNGVIFVCNYEENAICLGDMSNPDEVLTIPLSGGGSLRVNRDNIDGLAKAIGMFSPEDVNNILRAIAQDTQCKRKLTEIEDAKNKVGEETEEIK